MEELLKAEGRSEKADRESLSSTDDIPPSLTNQYLALYFRCRRFKDMQLPSAGGILDQEEITMQIFEIIHSMVTEYEREQQEDTMAKMQQQSRIAQVKQQVAPRGFRRR